MLLFTTQLYESKPGNSYDEGSLKVKDFAIDGMDIINMGCKSGPMIGAALKHLLNEVIEERVQNNKEDLVKECKCFWVFEQYDFLRERWYNIKTYENSLPRNTIRKNNYSQTALYPRKEWTCEECRLVLEHSIPDRELSKRISRSVQSIQIMRSRLKKQRK